MKPNCQNITDFPSPEDFQKSYNVWAYMFYSFGFGISTCLIIQYIIMTYRFYNHVPRDRLRQTLWINAVYMIVALFTFFSLLLPKSGPFLWAIYKIMVGISMAKFTELLFIWLGGESGMLNHFENIQKHKTTLQSNSVQKNKQGTQDQTI